MMFLQQRLLRPLVHWLYLLQLLLDTQLDRLGPEDRLLGPLSQSTCSSSGQHLELINFQLGQDFELRQGFAFKVFFVFVFVLNVSVFY